MTLKDARILLVPGRITGNSEVIVEIRRFTLTTGINECNVDITPITMTNLSFPLEIVGNYFVAKEEQ